MLRSSLQCWPLAKHTAQIDSSKQSMNRQAHGALCKCYFCDKASIPLELISFLLILDWKATDKSEVDWVGIALGTDFNELN